MGFYSWVSLTDGQVKSADLLPIPKEDRFDTRKLSTESNFRFLVGILLVILGLDSTIYHARRRSLDSSLQELTCQISLNAKKSVPRCNSSGSWYHHPLIHRP